MTADVGGDPHSPAVVLLHGGGQTRHAWGSTARALIEAGWYVVSLDLRGHGDSEWDSNGDYSLDLQVEDLRSVLKQSPRGQRWWCTLGGLLSLLTVGETPELVASRLVLVDVTPMLDPKEKRASSGS